jgi:hypothetical protein
MISVLPGFSPRRAAQGGCARHPLAAPGTHENLFSSFFKKNDTLMHLTHIKMQ